MMILKACLVLTFCLSFLTAGYTVFKKIKDRQEFWHQSFKGITNQLMGKRPSRAPTPQKFIHYSSLGARSQNFKLEISLGTGL